MNLREWARLTQGALQDQWPEDPPNLSSDQVEHVLRMSITTLVDALAEGHDLRIAQLGQIRVEERPSRNVAGNLGGRPLLYKIGPRKTVKFKVSDWLVNRLNSPRAK